MKYYVGIDIGGTNIKAGVVNDSYDLLSSVSVKTNAAKGYEYLAETMMKSGRI